MIASTMGIIAIVQARMGSIRFPGKSLAKVYKNFSLLEMVLLRTQKAKKLDSVILATSESKDCDCLRKIADSLRIPTIRGCENNVLMRFIKAIRKYKPHAIVRICADNPLIAFEEIDKLVIFFRSGNYDYAENKSYAGGLPDGLGAEIVRSDILLEIAKVATPEQGEHVTKYITDNHEQYRLATLKADKNLFCPDLKLDIDTPKDFEKMKSFCRGLPEESAPYWRTREIVETAKKFSY